MRTFIRTLVFLFISLPGIAMFFGSLFLWYHQMGAANTLEGAEAAGWFIGTTGGAFIFGFIGFCMVIVGKLLMPAPKHK